MRCSQLDARYRLPASVVHSHHYVITFKPVLLFHFLSYYLPYLLYVFTSSIITFLLLYALFYLICDFINLLLIGSKTITSGELILSSYDFINVQYWFISLPNDSVFCSNRKTIYVATWRVCILGVLWFRTVSKTLYGPAHILIVISVENIKILNQKVKYNDHV